ncbi:MAG: NAD(P)H-dependent oxidoreductase [Candidatus Omnitrophica bacterium]|nr:NAD(P)H-dependent oxidoreductase [Candidatus Omnitrophota bacterium]
MKKLLHIIATPRAEESRTLEVSRAFLKVFKETHADWAVDELNLSREKLPELTVKQVDGKYALLSGKDLDGPFKAAWRETISHIERFLSADLYLISTPMWNFNIPYSLKQYIDIIVQPKYLFRYVDGRAEGLVKGKKMVIIASRGGDYSAPETRGFDFQEPYLRAIFGFVGLSDIKFIVAQPMDMDPAAGKERIRQAQVQAEEAARNFATLN